MDDYKSISSQLTKRSEKCVLTGYYDSGKVATWGWGHTGPEVKVGQKIDQAEADIDFTRDQAEADATLHRHVPPAAFAALTGHEAAALLDFAFNTGGGPELGEKDEWNIWKVVRAGNLAAVPNEFNRFIYVHVNGKPVTSQGLKNRRTAEVVLWNTADVEAAVSAACAGGETVCSAATRTLPTPPVPSAPKALSKTSLGLKVSGVCTAAATACANYLNDDTKAKVSGLHDTVAAHAGELGHFGPAIVSTLGAAVCAIAVAQLFVHHEQQKAAAV